MSDEGASLSVSCPRATVATGLARIPSGSHTATPTRTLPTSIPSHRPRTHCSTLGTLTAARSPLAGPGGPIRVEPPKNTLDSTSRP